MLDGVELLLSDRYIVADIRLGYLDQPRDIVMPFDDGSDTVLQRRQRIDVGAEFGVGGVGGTARPEAANFKSMVLAGFQNRGDLLQNLDELLCAVIEDLLIGVGPPTRIQHPVDVLTGRLFYAQVGSPRNAWHGRLAARIECAAALGRWLSVGRIDSHAAPDPKRKNHPGVQATLRGAMLDNS